MRIEESSAHKFVLMFYPDSIILKLFEGVQNLEFLTPQNNLLQYAHQPKTQFFKSV